MDFSSRMFLLILFSADGNGCSVFGGKVTEDAPEFLPRFRHKRLSPLEPSAPRAGRASALRQHRLPKPSLIRIDSYA